MKKLLLIIPLLFTSQFVTAMGGEMGAHKHQRIKEELNLTKEQSIEFDKIHEKYTSKKEKLHGPELIRELDPNSADYQKKVDDYAEQLAQQAKERFLRHAQKHAELYNLLDESQREKLKQSKQCKFSKKKHRK